MAGSKVRQVGPGGKVSGGRPNTLGLGQRELAELLDRFESPESGGGKIKRNHVRWPFRQTSLRVQIYHPGGANAWITVACRNISRTGMSILHSAFMHPGTRCQIMLPHPIRGETPVEGYVTRCNHRSGVVHEIGIRFSQPVDVKEILRPDPLADWFSLERVHPQDLAGTLVCVDDSEIDRQIVRHFLRETRISFATAASAAEALTCIDRSTDVVLLDYHLGDGTGAEVAAKLRQGGCKAPIIIFTCDTQTALADRDGHVSAYLAKPLNQDLLLRALGEFLIVRKKPEQQSQSSAVSGAATTQLTEGISAAMVQYAKRIEDCIQRQDVQGARSLCLQISGTAGAGGFKEINGVAIKAAEALARSNSVPDSVTALRALISACQSSARRGR